MKIRCYFSAGCTSHAAVEENLARALAEEGIAAEVQYLRIDDGEAQRLGLRGSPTILIDGVDPFPSEASGFS